MTDVVAKPVSRAALTSIIRRHIQLVALHDNCGTLSSAAGRDSKAGVSRGAEAVLRTDPTTACTALQAVLRVLVVAEDGRGAGGQSGGGLAAILAVLRGCQGSVEADGTSDAATASLLLRNEAYHAVLVDPASSGGAQAWAADLRDGRSAAATLIALTNTGSGEPPPGFAAQLRLPTTRAAAAAVLRDTVACSASARPLGPVGGSEALVARTRVAAGTDEGATCAAAQGEGLSESCSRTSGKVSGRLESREGSDSGGLILIAEGKIRIYSFCVQHLLISYLTESVSPDHDGCRAMLDAVLRRRGYSLCSHWSIAC